MEWHSGLILQGKHTHTTNCMCTVPMWCFYSEAAEYTGVWRGSLFNKVELNLTIIALIKAQRSKHQLTLFWAISLFFSSLLVLIIHQMIFFLGYWILLTAYKETEMDFKWTPNVQNGLGCIANRRHVSQMYNRTKEWTYCCHTLTATYTAWSQTCTHGNKSKQNVSMLKGQIEARTTTYTGSELL